MKVTGKIEVLDVTQSEDCPVMIAETNNLFTNFGKQHICNWLLHNNYADSEIGNGQNPFTGGNSYSNMKMVPYSKITANRIGSHSYVENPSYCLYPNNNNLTNYMRLYCYNTNPLSGYDDQYGTIFFEFSTPIELYAILMFASQTTTTWNQFKMEISTSPNTFAQNTNWTRQKIDWLQQSYDNQYGNDTVTPYGGDIVKMIKFDHSIAPNRSISNVKCIRIRTWTYNTSYYSWGNFYSIFFFEKNDYPNTPSVIGLGTSDTTPLVTDTILGAESIRKFMKRHKVVANNQVKYSMRLDYTEGNDVTYKEVGLFTNPIAGDYIGGNHLAPVCSGMLARGIFDSPWSKTSEQVIDIDYTITIS